MSDVVYKPYIPAEKQVAELTLIPLLVGIVLGIIFGASSLYLALKIGMTVSASIPVAVLSITVFRAFSKIFKTRPATILENNIVQTTGSAGESIAFGVAVTMPAMLIWGYNIEMGVTTLIAVLGGLLGILMMIPLRHALIVEGHGKLAYPEGTACADVLMVGEKGGTSAITVFTGFFIALFYKIANLYMRMWKETAEKAFVSFKGAVAAIDVAPELLGVGYIIGARTACIMVAGGILSSFVLIPAIALFGANQISPMFPATQLIRDMSAMDIWKNYVLYIGAGAVAAGGIISLFQSLPTILRSLGSGLKDLKSSGSPKNVKRTERDLPMSVVLGGCVLLIAAITAAPALKMNLLGALLIVVFGFLFVTVASRVTGEIGSSSSPISGMTVATLLITSLIFLGMGWTQGDYRVTALAIAAIVCVAASNGGTTSQDLKTGFLVGATPRSQQIAILAGCLSSALVIGYVLILLNNASTVYTQQHLPQSKIDVTSLKKESLKGPDSLRDPGQYYSFFQLETAGDIHAGKYLVNDDGSFKYFIDPGINGVMDKRDDGTPVVKYQAPKARLMSLIIDGILTQKLPWSLVLLGVFIAVVLELCGISALPFAVGVYLPLSASSPIFVGGIVRWLVERGTRKKTEAESESSPGVLLSSGLIAGGSIAGILYAIVAQFPAFEAKLNMSAAMGHLAESDGFAVGIFLTVALFVYLVGKEKILKPKKA